MNVSIPDMHPTLKQLLLVSQKRKWISYEEINTSLPDKMVDPEKLDELLHLIERLGIEFYDEPTARRLANGSRFLAPLATNLKFKRDDPRRDAGPIHVPSDIDGDHEASHGARAGTTISDQEAELLDEPDAQAVIEQVIAESGTKRIDDPIRMYLTQMGTIPLLTREEEIRLAKKIETTRMIFRRRVLESDYTAAQAVDTLQQVHEGNLPFDRTMRISTAEANAKEKVASRIPINLKTIRLLLQLSIEDWEFLEEGVTDKQRLEIEQTMARRRRKVATMLEECCLRTAKIQPLLRKLQSINKKIRSLQRDLVKAEKHPGRYDPEDVYVMQEELDGLRSLVLENPEQLHRRVNEIVKVFNEYEQAKRDLSGGNLRLVVSIAKKYRNRG
ncbi:MAG: RNA polymerase subunit sigma-70, partial [Planctomycetota bacterium]|nr:RNA polymerase subunit sigma-70 [Planctomycetota bacterium]